MLFPAGVICIYLADAIFAYKTGQKLRIINYLVYILGRVTDGLCFRVRAGTSAVGSGLADYPAGSLVDVVLIVIKMAQNAKYKYRPEVDAAWNEN